MKTIQPERYRTPYRCSEPLLTASGKKGAFDEKSVDVPFIFRHRGKFWMLYTGFDGVGYQSALAVSGDLVHWKFHGMVLERGKGGHGWDDGSASATWILRESDDLFRTPRLGTYHGRYWMAYHSYPGEGYESGPAEIGLAWTQDEELLDWHRLETPVLSWRDGAPWEAGGLYKACLIRRNGEFLMFYNAKDREQRWTEQTGMARSRDLVHFERCPQNPLLRVSPGRWDGRFVSDPCIERDGDLWLDFYFGYDSGHAQEGLAFSGDLVTWEKLPEPILPHGEPGSNDENHAHKASVLFWNGTLYHFYCATRPSRPGDCAEVFHEFRTICAAASRPWNETVR